MFFVFFAGILLLLFFIAWLFRVRLESTLVYSPEEKYVKFELLLHKYLISDYVFSLRKNENERYEIQYIKKHVLIHTYLISELIVLWRDKKASKNISFIRDADLFAYKEKVHIGRVSIRTDLGWEDAATTAILHGIFIALLNAGLGKLYSSLGFPKAAEFKINPYYDKMLFNTSIEIVFTMRFIYLLLARVKIAFYNIKKRRQEALDRQKVFRESLRQKAC
jgi:hypothetical protein